MVQISSIGARMKSYESMTSLQLPSKTWAVLRLDGKAFHSYTRDLQRPFDKLFLVDMTNLMTFLARKIGGAVFGYTQSDEISIIFHDLGSPQQELWFGGKVQKIVSVAASYAGAQWSVLRNDVDNFGVFDARVFPLPSVEEVKNYLLWRQQDSLRNALFMAASEFFTHKQLLGKKFSEKISMLESLGIDWREEYPARARLGAIAGRVANEEEVTYTRKDTGEEMSTLAARSFWVSRAAVPFKDSFQTSIFTFLNPKEPPCQPHEFLSSELTPA